MERRENQTRRKKRERGALAVPEEELAPTQIDRTTLLPRPAQTMLP